jgi:Cu+-exporting ATPase
MIGFTFLSLPRHETALSFALTQFLLLLPILYVTTNTTKRASKAFAPGTQYGSLIAIGSSAAVIYGVAALFQIGYGLGHGDTARVTRWVTDLYFESAA